MIKMKDNHSYYHDDSGWIHIIVDDEHDYFTPCPHCCPSWFLYKPNVLISEVCHMAKSEKCVICCEPECELARGVPISEFTTKDEET